MANQFKSLAQLAKHAWKLESETPGGRFNWRGLSLLMILILALTFSDGLQLIAEVLRPSLADKGVDMTQLAYTWVGLFVLCMAAIFAEDHLSQKYLGNAPGGGSDSPEDAD